MTKEKEEDLNVMRGLPEMLGLTEDFIGGSVSSSDAESAKFRKTLTLTISELGDINDAQLVYMLLDYRRLDQLYLGYFSKITDETIRHISEEGRKPGILTKLSVVSCTNITGRAIRYISEGFPNLTELNLSYSPRITDEEIRFLSTFENLRELNLNYCTGITMGGVAASLMRSTKLEKLHFACGYHYLDVTADVVAKKLITLIKSVPSLNFIETGGPSFGNTVVLKKLAEEIIEMKEHGRNVTISFQEMSLAGDWEKALADARESRTRSLSSSSSDSKSLPSPKQKDLGKSR